MSLYKKRILITGATGFIGANLARYFIERENKPYVILRKESDTWRINDILDGLVLFHADLSDNSAIIRAIKEIRPEVVFHTASYGGHPFQKEEDEIIRTNITGTMNLVNACSEAGCDFFINTGSSSEYGIENKPLKESDVLKPNNAYGASKASATLFCQMKARTGPLPIVTLRLFSPYGYYEEDTRLMSSVILSCLKGVNPRLSSPTSVRDFIFIEDVIESYIKVVQNKNKISGQIFNIGNGRQHTVEEVVKATIELTGNNVKPEWEIVSNPRIEPKTWQADISKIKADLLWQPQYSLKDGIAKNIQWFRKNLSLYTKEVT